MLGQESSRAIGSRAPHALACGVALLALLLSLAVAAGPAQAAKKGTKNPPVSLSAPGAKVVSGKATRLKGSVKKWAKGQRVVLLAKPTGTKRWARASATKLKKNGRFSFKVKPPLGKTAYKAVAQRRSRKAPKAHSKPLRLLGLPGATATLSVGAGGQVTVGGLLPTPIKRKVVLQRREGGGWKAAGSKSSSKKGRVSFRVRVTASASYRLYAPKFTVKAKGGKSKHGKKKGSKTRKRPGAVLSRAKGKSKKKATTYPPFTSPPITVRVSSRKVALTLPADLCTAQQTDATVTASPVQAGGAIQVQASEDGGATWTVLGEGGEDASGTSPLRFVGPETSGTYSFRAVLADGSASAPQTAEVHVCFGFPPLPQIYSGGNDTCEIDAYGEAWCWGENRFGQLGDGSFEERTKPVKVAGGNKFVELAVGAEHTCGLTADGRAYCWGANGGAPVEGFNNNDEGALGDGSETNRNVPTPVSGGLAFKQISADGGHTCGITTAGAAYCWGYNKHGELGDGSLDNRLAPTRVQGGGFEEIVTYSFRSCGLSGGRVYCWGEPLSAPNPYTPKPEDGVPHQLGGSYPPLHGLSLGSSSGCALSSAGAAYCWGSDYDGELGQGSLGTYFTETPIPVIGGHTFSKIDGGLYYNCGLAEGGSTLCWGSNNFGLLGQGDSDIEAHPTPEPVVGGHVFTRLAAGGRTSCAIDSGGFAWCWGWNYQGQLGVGVAGEEHEARYKPNTVLFPGVS